jgi:hypothetical protein
MKVATSICLFLLVACVTDAQAIQHTECTNSSTCSLPNPVASGNMIVVIGGLPDAFDLQGDTFFEISAKGWYATASPMWYATGVHGGAVTVRSSAAAPYFYLAEYPPSTLDQIAPQVFNCCEPSAAIGLTTTLPKELLIEWTIYPASVAVQDATVAPGAHSFTIPQGTSGAWGAELVSFRLLGPEFVKYKAPYAPIQLKACFAATCQFDNPVSTNDLLVAAIDLIGCDPPLACVTDTEGNVWSEAVHGIYAGRLWYTLNAKAGSTAVSFIPANSSASVIIAEYPPAVAIDGTSFGTYAAQDLDGPQGGSDDVGWTLPVQTTKPCDLLVSMGINQVTPPDPTSSWIPDPVPYFTVRAGLADRIGFEDGTSSIPGVYIASMDFHNYTHWTEGLAAFDLNGCK